MSRPHIDARLRMELLRLRGQVQRAEATAALDEVRVGTQGLRALLAAGVRLAGASPGGLSWATMLGSGLRDRAWLAGTAMFALRAALRTARRHPLAAAIGTAVAVAAWRVLRPAAPKPPAPAPGPDADRRPG